MSVASGTACPAVTLPVAAEATDARLIPLNVRARAAKSVAATLRTIIFQILSEYVAAQALVLLR